MSTRTFTFEERLYGALHAARELRRRNAGPAFSESGVPYDRAGEREIALIITKLEEAAMWNDAARAKKGLDPLGLDWKP